jgi:hypothetical protein
MRPAAAICVVIFCAVVAGDPIAAQTESTLKISQGLPVIYWTQGIETAPALKRAGLEQLAVPSEHAEAWRKAGFKILVMTREELGRREKLLVPRIAGRADVASATRRPWIDANGWRFARHPAGKFYYDLPAGKATLAIAEAFIYGADAVVKIDPADLEETGKMLVFLRASPQENLSPIADIAVIDDGSAVTGEVMNLLTRRNLLYRVVSSPSSQFSINIKIGTREYPTAAATDPSAFAQKIRLQLTDERRSLRIYGSEVVICRLAGSRARMKLHLLNYSGRGIEGLRIRLRGAYGRGEAKAFGYGNAVLEDFIVADGATEFSIAQMGVYAVVDFPVMK